MLTLEDVNQLGKQWIDEYRILSFDGSRLVIVGSFDLGYYHNVELMFTEVDLIRCPTYFMAPTFRDAGPVEDYYHRYEIETDGEQHEIIAMGVTITQGTVFYYDRGADLKLGERIADWVKREPL